jgi:predicted Ser/Thr protein kinase
MSDAEKTVSILYDAVPRMLCPFCRGRMDVSGIQPFSKALCPACHREVPVPARLGAFLLLELLGTGGMGGVYRAHDETLGRDVAIKVMLKSYGDNPDFVQAFRREAQAAAKLNHPNIAQIYSFGQEKGQPYIVMELVSGKHLDQMIAEQPGRLDPALVVRICADIAGGLQMAAASNLIHGDIKPENILLNERQQAKLVDFGIATNTSQGTGEIWGTPYYIAPEKVRRQRIDYRSDIYCLGGTLYHALSGKPPFDGADAIEVVKARFKGPPAPLESIRPDLDPELIAIVNRMLQFEPAMRYPTYESLLSDMRHYLGRAAPQAAPAVKRVVIKGKASAVAGNTARVPGAATQAAETRASGATAPAPSATGRSKTIMVSRGMIPDVMPAAAGNAETDASRGASPFRVLLRAAGLVVLVLLLLGGAAAGAVFWHRQRSERLAGQAREMETRRLLGLVGKGAGEIAALRAALAGHVGEGHLLATQAVALAAAELGEDMAARIMAEAEAAPAEEEEGGITNAPPAAAGEEEEGVAATPPAAGGDSPAGEELPLPARLARDAWLAARPLRQAARRAAQIEERAAAIVQESRAATNDLPRLRRGVAAIDLLKEDLQGVLARAPQWVEDVRQAHALVAGEVRRLAAARAAAEAERARLEAERLAAEEEARRQAALEAAVAAEIAAVRDAIAARREALAAHRYDEVLRELKALETREVRTEEGRRHLRLACERVERLRSLQQFLARRLNEEPFISPLGWSVQGATDRHLAVRGISGKVEEVPWERIGAEQIVPFIRFYLLDEARARDLKLRERISQSLNAAVYCLTFGGESEAARGLAAALAGQAEALFPDSREDARRLLPELFAAESP